jgi:PAS domain S-box-containing protein
LLPQNMQAPSSVPESGDPLTLPAQQVLRQVRDHAIFLIDLQGRIASWNEGVGLILGWPEAAWLGQPADLPFTPEDQAAGLPAQEMQLARDTGRADDDRWMMRRSGERFFAAGSMARLLDAADRPVGYLKVLRDFTALKLAEQERERLVAEQNRAHSQAGRHAAALTAAIEATAEGVLIADQHGITRCNSAAMTLLGIGNLDQLPREPAALIPAFRFRRDREGALLAAEELPLLRALAGEATALELWATRPSGEQHCFRTSAAPIVLDGQVTGAVSVHSDLSERLRLHQSDSDLVEAETVLRERDQELRALLHGIRDYAIFTLTPDGRISSWHQGAMLMKGYTPQEAIGMRYAHLFTPEQQAEGRPEQEMAQAARDGEFKGEGIRLRKDGSIFDAAVVLTALRAPDGSLLGFLKMTQDISERRLHERQLEQALRDARRARTEAERANHAKGEFLATISHELRTPLSAMLGWAHLLERGTGDPALMAQGLAAISRNARVQVQLIEDLLDMNRIVSGQLRLDLQHVDLAGVLAATVDSVLPAATAKGLALRTALDDSVGLVVGDAGRLQQVVGNLLSNAIKFTPAGGHVEVLLEQAGEIAGQGARITVADDGQGIDPAFLPRVFDRFQQQDATTTRRHGGLGIGLAVVRHLVQLHGGTVRAESAGAGRGARFTVLLPPGQAAVMAAGTLPVLATVSVAAPLVSAQRLDGTSVLLVDDEPDVRAMTEQVLREAGARVRAVGSADEGLAALTQAWPDIILCDIGMPVQDGYDFLRRVRLLPAGADIPAAAFTAYARPEDRQRAFDAGFRMHLAKPVMPAALVEAVSNLARGAG